MRQILGVLFLSLFLFLAGGALEAQPAPPDLLERKLLEGIEALDRSLTGVMGVAAIDLTTGRVLEYHAETQFPTASSIKVAILAQMFLDAQSGRMKWDDTLTLTPQDTVGGSGYLHRILRRHNFTLSHRELAEAMIEDSDNLATNKSIDLVGMERVNQMLEAHGLGGVRLRRKMMDTEAARAGQENVATPREMARLMRMVWDGSLVGKAASGEMIGILKRVEADMRRAIPGTVEVAAKPGELDGVRCEAGLVLLAQRPFALVVMSSYLDDLENPVPQATRLVYRYFEKLAHSNGTGRRLE